MRADLLDRVQLVCPPCTWKRGSPAALRLDRTDGGREEVLEGTLRCVRCGEVYPILQGIPVVASEGYRRVAAETAEVDDPLALLGPHGLAHFADLLPGGEREGLRAGDFWPRLAALPGGDLASGLAVDLSCSAGRAALGLSRRAAFTLGLDASFVTARLARASARAGRFPVRVVEEGAVARVLQADLSPLLGGALEFVVADPELPPLPPGIAAFVLAANLLERQGDPEAFLRRAASLLAPGGSLAVASPFAWWEGGAPREGWLGRDGERAGDALVRILGEAGLEVLPGEDLLLVLRETARLEQVVRPRLVVARRP